MTGKLKELIICGHGDTEGFHKRVTPVGEQQMRDLATQLKEEYGITNPLLLHSWLDRAVKCATIMHEILGGEIQCHKTLSEDAYEITEAKLIELIEQSDHECIIIMAHGVDTEDLQKEMVPKLVGEKLPYQHISYGRQACLINLETKESILVG
ncbi:histidine phosphatase family protein [Patescibacteria group bacterium]|nr:histidine phosphatase family protein [Patescibacteria group bacterium]